MRKKEGGGREGWRDGGRESGNGRDREIETERGKILKEQFLLLR